MLEMNYKNFFYYVDHRVANYYLGEGMPTNFVTYCLMCSRNVKTSVKLRQYLSHLSA